MTASRATRRRVMLNVIRVFLGVVFLTAALVTAASTPLAARLSVEKGVEYLVEAFTLLRPAAAGREGGPAR